MGNRYSMVCAIGMAGSWYVYMVRCADGSLYTGVTTDVSRRVKEHNGEAGKGKGAKYTKAHRPVVLVHSEKVLNRSVAQIREAELRKLPKIQKEKFAIITK
jgi:putative endonuclease